MGDGQGRAWRERLKHSGQPEQKTWMEIAGFAEEGKSDEKQGHLSESERENPPRRDVQTTAAGKEPGVCVWRERTTHRDK